MQSARPTFRIVCCALTAMACTGQTVAQTTNCMAMGPDMVNCNTIGPNGLSTTNCTALGDGMATCNTMGPPPVANYKTDDSAPRQGHGLVSLLAAAKERSVRKRVGERIAAGDCQGAAQYALANGRLELAGQVQRACQTTPATSTGSSLATKATLADMITREVARLRRVPMAAAGQSGPIRVEAVNQQILISERADRTHEEFSLQEQRALVNKICADAEFTPLLQLGGSIRFVYVDFSGRDIGAAMATRQVCGI